MLSGVQLPEHAGLCTSALNVVAPFHGARAETSREI